jgi:uncharacterized protein YdhG (YjbR/CyaY superfamily)
LQLELQNLATQLLRAKITTKEKEAERSIYSTPQMWEERHGNLVHALAND